MLFGLSRKAATEFSFFLAVPTLIAAGAYDLWKNRALFSRRRRRHVRASGSVVSFVSAFVVIRWLIRYVATHDFRPFAWYRHRLRHGGAADRVLRLGRAGTA